MKKINFMDMVVNKDIEERRDTYLIFEINEEFLESSDLNSFKGFLFGEMPLIADDLNVAFGWEIKKLFSGIDVRQNYLVIDSHYEFRFFIGDLILKGAVTKDCLRKCGLTSLTEINPFSTILLFLFDESQEEIEVAVHTSVRNVINNCKKD